MKKEAIMRRPHFLKNHFEKCGAKKPAMINMDRNEQFVVKKCAMYLDRLLDRHDLLEDETFDFLNWILGADMEKIGRCLISLLRESDRRTLEEDISESEFDARAYATAARKAVRGSRKRNRASLKAVMQETLRERIRTLHYRDVSGIEKNLSHLKKMFALTDQEVEFTLIFFILKSYGPAEDFFDSHLHCDAFMGRKYLATLLKTTHTELNDIITGKLFLMGLFEVDHYINFTSDFSNILENPSGENSFKSFFTRVSRKAIPLENHLIDKKQTDHILNLLKKKTDSSTHILLYGSAGTGKSSYAIGLARALGIPAYEIVRGDENKTSQRRAAILAALNMTNNGSGSLIIVDEADNILDTQFSFHRRGETQDKGWLNHLLEVPGARIIWITNSIFGAEDSVLRRFAFSLHFKPFNRRQRIQLWESILRVNRVKRRFSRSDIDDLAKRYKVTAGAIDIAVKKARDIGVTGDATLKDRVIMALDAHKTLFNSGRREIKKDEIEKNYSLEGLNMEGDLNTMMDQLQAFDRYLRAAGADHIRNMNLLFYGPPGTGKSELARYIANRLDREILTRRASDILSPYIGETEQNIRKAFEEAENEEAILIIDEVDTMLFNRGQAQRSWEISFTNEFLTQMERYRGMLICTTNRLQGLDEASIRRFNHKIGFHFLKPEGNMIFYRTLLLPLTNTHLEEEIEESLLKISDLAPGDFRVVRDRFSFYPKEQVTPRIMIDALEAEVRTKKVHKQHGGKIGF